MDIKPFQMPDLNIWMDAGPVWIILGAISAITTIASWIMMHKKGSEWGTLAVIGLIGMSSAAIILAQGLADAGNAAYDSHVSQLKDSLSDDGFKIISGSPNLWPNAQSDILLSYEGSNFDCTLFTPEEVETSIVFSCGEAKLNLHQIKESK